MDNGSTYRFRFLNYNQRREAPASPPTCSHMPELDTPSHKSPSFPEDPRSILPRTVIYASKPLSTPDPGCDETILLGNKPPE
uniref:Fibronectin type-III domain-containing protein n=1 Tax=Steinernema glaseri TaxID=37863 RepID=A0A1I7YTJ0_9BILA